MQIEDKELDTQHYIYAEASAPMMDGEAIGQAMGAAFGTAFGAVQSLGLTPLSAPMTVYTEMPGTEMTFRSGFIVSAEDAAKVSGALKSAELPAGKALFAMHVGPYSGMGQTHQAMWAEVKSRGLTPVMPTWEIYIDDPQEVDEDSMRTEIYHHLAG